MDPVFLTIYKKRGQIHNEIEVNMQQLSLTEHPKRGTFFFSNEEKRNTEKFSELTLNQLISLNWGFNCTLHIWPSSRNERQQSTENKLILFWTFLFWIHLLTIENKSRHNTYETAVSCQAHSPCGAIVWKRTNIENKNK